MAVEFPQANSALQKLSVRMNLSGAGSESPILSGLSGTMEVQLREGEALRSWRIYSGDPDTPDFENIFSVGTDGPFEQALVFGTDTDTGTVAVRNYVEWITDRGKTVRQFWVRDLPGTGSLYIQNQEAQGSQAFYQITSGDPLSFGINILPNFADEFFKLHEITANRWTNTLRPWGGAKTAEVFLGGGNIITEQYIGDVHGYYWPNPSPGTHTILVRVRAEQSSVNFVDISGTIFVEFV
jgi:hypothetical protein